MSNLLSVANVFRNFKLILRMFCVCRSVDVDVDRVLAMFEPWTATHFLFQEAKLWKTLLEDLPSL